MTATTLRRASGPGLALDYGGRVGLFRSYAPSYLGKIAFPRINSGNHPFRSGLKPSQTWISSGNAKPSTAKLRGLHVLAPHEVAAGCALTPKESLHLLRAFIPSARDFVTHRPLHITLEAVVRLEITLVLVIGDAVAAHRRGAFLEHALQPQLEDPVAAETPVTTSEASIATAANFIMFDSGHGGYVLAFGKIESGG
ncbi:hypothetical protein ON010_g14888 [Phytophthora cinnamomi]|nr:hypothetical protein ON010_g14888 [Phytophthora cinnamomi]